MVVVRGNSAGFGVRSQFKRGGDSAIFEAVVVFVDSVVVIAVVTVIVIRIVRIF